MHKKLFILLLYILGCIKIYSQDVSLYEQFNGRYDFLAFGNTLNTSENPASCTILTESSANFSLEPSQTLVAAYLYWAGSGTGDFDVELNNTEITAERTFSYTLTTAFAGDQPFFAAFADVTSLVDSIGSTSYTLSELDLTTVITTNNYCANRTNFGGWSILVIYEDDSLPLNQVSIFDGLQAVSRVSTELTLVLDNLNVLDNIGAKIGFLTWEGDAGLALTETLSINGNIIGNPPLNPTNNAFNGTNSYTESSELYNMDMDFYGVQDNIAIGDTEATIQLTSGADFVMVNNIVTKFNSQLPDATISIDNIQKNCNSGEILVDFTIYNTNSTDPLPENTPIGIYANGELINTFATLTELDIDEQESQQVWITIPDDIPLNFTLETIVDNEDLVTEINEDNNNDTIEINQIVSPQALELDNLMSCNLGFGQAIFDIETYYNNLIASQPSNFDITFFASEADALSGIEPLILSSEFLSNGSPQTIYVKVINTDVNCFSIDTFQLIADNCPPTIPNAFTPNNDGINDVFEIDGLRDIFEDYELTIYNRWGSVMHKENNNTPQWNGKHKGEYVPNATYFYVLNLNDENYKPFVGWVYVVP